MPHSTRRSWPRLIALVVGLGTVVVGSSSLVLSDEETVPKRSSRSSKSSSGGSSANVDQKLDEILANQKAILQKFDAIMEELRIIKVRTIYKG